MSADPEPEALSVPHEPPIPLRAWWQTGATSVPAVLIVPALGTPARVYDRLARALHARGFHVVVTELRGTGASEALASRNQDWGYLDLVDGELASTYQHVQHRIGAAVPMVWLGHSLGGHLALLHQRRHRARQPADILLAASGAPYFAHYSLGTRAGLLALSAMMHASHALLGYFAGHRLGFGGRQPRTLMRQWLRFAWRGALPEAVMRGPADGDPPQPETAACRAALSMIDDHWAPRPATAHLCAAFDTEPVIDALDQLEDGARPDHFSWLRQPSTAAAWVHAQLGS